MKTFDIEERKQMEEIILHCDICFVGITDLTGNPYVIPMNFGYEEGIIYLHSGPDGSKLDMLSRNSQVCVTFCEGHELAYQHPNVACSYRMRSKSVICRGQVRFVEEMTEKRRSLDIIMRQYTSDHFNYSDPAVRNVKIWQVEVENMTGKVFGVRAGEQP